MKQSTGHSKDRAWSDDGLSFGEDLLSPGTTCTCKPSPNESSCNVDKQSDLS